MLDLAWSPDGSALVSGSIANECLVWDVETKKSLVGNGAVRVYLVGVLTSMWGCVASPTSASCGTWRQRRAW